MSAYAPEPPSDPDERRPGPATERGELSVRDRKILDEIAGYENGSDPAFVARLRERSPRPARPMTERVIQGLIVAVVLGLMLPTAWVMVGLILIVMIVLPALLAWYGRRLGPDERTEDGTGDRTHDDRS